MIRPRLTYANVMSTIAVFAALSTGGAYAATKLAANSVGTAQIRNGQVTYADLHPSVRAKLGKAPTTGGGWQDSNVIAPGAALFPCGGNECDLNPEWDPSNYTVGYTKTVGISSKIGTTGNMEARITGSITNRSASASARIRVYVFGAATSTVAASNDNHMRTCSIDVPASQTVAISLTDNACNPIEKRPSKDTKYLRFRIAGESTMSLDATSTLKIEVRKAG